MYKYLALIWDTADSRSATRALALQMTLTRDGNGWQVAYRNNGVLAMHQPILGQPYRVFPLANSRGVVLGSIFRRVSSETSLPTRVSFHPSETQIIIDSRGHHLVQRYWGSYFAVAGDMAGECSVLRAPTGNLACYHHKWDGIHVFFSDMQDLVRHLPVSLSTNWTHVAARLLGGFQLSRECAINEIEDVIGGEWITFSANSERRVTVWHPAQFCNGEGFEDVPAAARELRAAVTRTTSTLASEHTNILLRLSGGLDSSIVATCLAQTQGLEKSNIVCTNFFIPTARHDQENSAFPIGLSVEMQKKLRRMISSGDEREFARRVALKCGFRLVEREKNVSDLKLEQIWHAPLVPRPSNYANLLYEDEVEYACARESGATACFSGEAGDTVFFNTLHAISALDYIYCHGLRPELLRQIQLTAHLSGEPYPHVAWKALKHGMLSIKLPKTYDHMKRPHLLLNDVAGAVDPNYFHHPWVDTAPRLCPGKELHVLAVANFIATYPHILHRDRIAPSVTPLAAQPVVELCLRIPTYVLLADGIPRGLARRAFADMLPTEVVKRTTKGATTAFVQDSLRYNMKFIRERLLDGILVKEKLLDRRKLDEFLTEDQPFLVVNSIQLLDYLACEGWLAQQASLQNTSSGALNWETQAPPEAVLQPGNA